MDERALHEVLHAAAAGADLPERFRRPSSLVRTAHNRSHLRWRRTALVIALLSAMCTVTLVFSPAARTLAGDAIKGLVSIWQGKVDGKPADLRWVDPKATNELIQKGQLIPVQDKPVEYRSMDEAAAALGFRPAEFKDGRAKLIWIGVQTHEWSAQNRSLFVSTTYKVGDKPVYLITETTEYKQGDTWKPASGQQLKVQTVTAAPPTNVRTLQVGGHEALAYDAPDGAVIKWLLDHDTLLITLTGPDAKLLEELAPSAMR